MQASRQTLRLTLLRATPAIMFMVILVLFSMLSPRFLSPQNFANILTQSAYIAIMAIGMTFVLLIAGVDLSIGAAMYVSAAILILYFPSLPGLASILLMACLGAVFGAINATFIVKLKVHPVRGDDRDAVRRARLRPVSVLHQDDPGPGTGPVLWEGSWLGVSYAILTLAILFVSPCGSKAFGPVWALPLRDGGRLRRGSQGGIPCGG